MKQEQIIEILNDIYLIDPSLKEYDLKLKDVILEIYYSKPDTEFDENFKNTLKEELLNKIYSLKRENINKTINLSSNLSKQSKLLINMRKLNYILGGVAVGVTGFAFMIFYLSSIGYINFSDKSNEDNLNTYGETYQVGLGIGKEISFSPKIEEANKKMAFGKISLNSNSGSESTNLTAPSGRGGGGFGSTQSASDSAVTDNKMMVPYIPTKYNFNYSGSKDLLNYNDTNFNVLKRVNNTKLPFDNSFNFKNADLSKFSNLNINSLVIDEDKDKGYTLYFNISEGSFSIGKNWKKWPLNTTSLCVPEKPCTEVNNIRVTDIPSDQDLIKIANDFVNQYNIDLTNYGPAEVQNQWRIEYERSTNKSSFYLPQSISIMYPLMVNGKYVYEVHGTKAGINVSIDTINKVVDGLWNIQTQNYQSSSYDLIKDTDRILKVAKLGSIYNTYYIGEAKEINVNISDPSLAYARISKYLSNETEEYLVPALVFKVDPSSTTEPIYQTEVVIPLTKEIIEETEANMQIMEENTKGLKNNAPESGATDKPAEIKPQRN